MSTPKSVVATPNSQELVTQEKIEPKYIPSQDSIIKPSEVQKVDNYTYIPSQDNIFTKNNSEKAEDKYIPSQVGAKFNKTFDNPCKVYRDQNIFGIKESEYWDGDFGPIFLINLT